MNRTFLKLSLRFFGLLAFIVGAACFNAAFAQTANPEAQVAKIRQLYAETNQRIDAGAEDKSAGLHHAGITVGGDKDGQQWRAVGNRNQTTEFYFNCEPEEPECPTDVRQFLVKVVGTYQAGSSITTRFEYLFNDKAELVFAFTVEEDEETFRPVERRFYFSKGKLIRIARDGKNIDAKFTTADLAKAKEELGGAKDQQNLFAIMLGK